MAFYILMTDKADKTRFQPGTEPSLAQILCKKEKFPQKISNHVLFLLGANFIVNIDKQDTMQNNSVILKNYASVYVSEQTITRVGKPKIWCGNCCGSIFLMV